MYDYDKDTSIELAVLWIGGIRHQRFMSIRAAVKCKTSLLEFHMSSTL